MNKNNKIISIIVVLVLLGAAFYAGTKYAEGKSVATRGGFAAGQGRFGGAFGSTTRGGRGGAGGGFTGGEIISKDDRTITVKLTDGGSKIIFYSTSTPVIKTTAGSVSDLSIGTQITAVGNANSDGSVTAQSIQIRPAGEAQTRSIPASQ